MDALQVPWQERFALYPHERENLVNTLLPSDTKFYQYSILHALHELPPGKDITPRIQELLSSFELADRYSSIYKSLKFRCDLIRLNSKDCPAKEKAEIQKNLKKNQHVQLDHSPPGVEGNEQETRYSNSSKIAPLDAWMAEATKNAHYVLDRLKRCAFDLASPKDLQDGNQRVQFLTKLANERRFDVHSLLPVFTQQLVDESNSVPPTLGSGVKQSILDGLSAEALLSLKSSLPVSAWPVAFIAARIKKMLPEKCYTSVVFDKETLEVFEQLHAFTSQLSAKFQDIKLQIHYWVLRIAWEIGTMDETPINALFDEYVRYPRSFSKKKLSEQNRRKEKKSSRKEKGKKSFRKHSFESEESVFVEKEKLVSFGNNSLPSSLYVSSTADSELITDYLSHYFIKDPSKDSLSPYQHSLDEPFLFNIMARAKLYSGQGDSARWCKILNNPAEVQRLNEDVEIQFGKGNKERFLPDEEVQLQLRLKNVPKLIVKMFEINTGNYYRQTFAHVNTSIDLDGLVAREETLHDFSEHAPIRRFEETFSFPSLQGKRGVFVLEFIGNGKSSRALIYKGWLNYVSYTTAAGQVISVIDEQKNKLKDVSVWFKGTAYSPHGEGDGDILVPFSSSQMTVDMLISHQGFTTLEQFVWIPESYQFLAGISIDREALLPSSECDVLFQLQLFVANTPAPLDCVDKLELVTTTKTHSGASTSKDADLTKQLKSRCGGKPQGEIVSQFVVPPSCSSVTFELTASVRVVSKAETSKFSVSQTFQIGSNASTRTIEDTFFRATDNAKNLEINVLGRSGEPINGHFLHLTLHHRWIRASMTNQLQTGADGRASLIGESPDSLLAVGQVSDGNRTWTVPHSAIVKTQYPATINHQAGVALHLLKPVLADSHQLKVPRDCPFVSLVRVNSQRVVLHDHTSSVSEDGPFYVVKGDLPEGIYRLLFKNPAQGENLIEIEIHLVPGSASTIGPFWVYERQCLERQSGRSLPLAIASVTNETVKGTQDTTVKIKLLNHTPNTRVHVVRSMFSPPFSLFDALRVSTPMDPMSGILSSVNSQFVTGRELGDEFRYIIDRRYHTKYAGSLVPPPTFQIRPWAVREIGESQGTAQGGDAYAQNQKLAEQKMRGGRVSSRGVISSNNSSLLDFLQFPSVSFANLRPAADGSLSILLEKDRGTYLQIVAIDGDQMVGFDSNNLPSAPVPCRNLVLSPELALNPSLHYVEEQAVAILGAGEKFDAVRSGSRQVEMFLYLNKVVQLFTQLGTSLPDEFLILSKWTTLSSDEKLKQYETLASHEMNFFLLMKDFSFFEEHVKPELQLKHTKTFLDYFFLGDSQKVSSYLQPFLLLSLNPFESVMLGAMLDRLDDVISMLSEKLGDQDSKFQNFVSSRFHKALSLGGMDDLGPPGGGGGGGGFEVAGLQRQAKRRARQASLCMSAAFMPAMARNRRFSNDFSMDSCDDEDDFMDSCSMASSCEEEEEEEDCRSLSRSPRARMRTKEVLKSRQLQEKQPPKYQPVGKTKEFEERGYYKVSVTQQNTRDFVRVSQMWVDYAVFLQNQFLLAKKAHPELKCPADLLLKHKLDAPFLSENFHLVGGSSNPSFHEALFTLAVLGLPFQEEVAQEHPLPTVSYTDTGSVATIIAQSLPCVVFHADLRPIGSDTAETAEKSSDILIAQTVCDPADLHNERGEEKYLPQDHEFVPSHPYMCKVIMTNVSSVRKNLKLLTQIPTGSLALETQKQINGGFYDVEPYSTQTFTYYFYFPANGDFVQYPAHVSLTSTPVGWADVRTYRVVVRPERTKTSWKNIARFGTNDEVIDHLQQRMRGKEVSYIYFRLKEKGFYEQLLDLYRSKMLFDPVLWGYSLLHQDIGTIKELLEERGGLRDLIGNGYFSCDFLNVDPSQRLWYVHREYAPLIEQRTHQLGAKRKLLNDGLRAQYINFLNKLCYQPSLSLGDAASAAYFLFLMLRDAEAIELFERFHGVVGSPSVGPSSSSSSSSSSSPPIINPERDNEEVSPEFLDYLRAYILLKKVDLDGAEAIVDRYLKHPIARLRERMALIKKHVEEARSADYSLKSEVSESSSTKIHGPSLSLSIKEGQAFSLRGGCLTQDIEVNYYVMDIELLFSTAPFSATSENTSKFSYVLPTYSEKISLDQIQKGEEKFTYEHLIPKKFQGSNLMVEVRANDIRKSAAYFANKMRVDVVENFGQLQVLTAETNRPIPCAYVKVYSRTNPSAKGSFYKDGYTDVRGIFDYVSLTNEKLSSVSRFAILVISEENGALIAEASPPPS